MLTETQKALLDAVKNLKARKVRGVLKKEKGYCIQGMMCEAYRQVLDESEWTDVHYSDEYLGFKFKNHPPLVSAAPIEVIHAFGISGQQAEKLMHMNDDLCVRTRDMIRKLKEYMEVNNDE